MYIGICECTRLAKRLSDGTLKVVTVIETYRELYDILVFGGNSVTYDIAWRFNYLVVDDNILEPIESFHMLDGHPSCKILD